MFITIEGIDGSGKSTVIELLKPNLHGWYCTKEPTDGFYGRKARDYIQLGDAPEEALYRAWLFMLDREQHAKRLSFEIEQGHNVLCDRYLDSTLAYSGAELHAGHAEGFNDLAQGMCYLYHMHPTGIPIPDRTFVLLVEPSISLKRTQSRRRLSKYDSNRDFLKRVHSAYEVLSTMAGHRIELIDTNGCRPQEVVDIILKRIRDLQTERPATVTSEKIDVVA